MYGLDVDECGGVDNGGCDQLCYNSHGSSWCECRAGWTLDPDGKTCRGKDVISYVITAMVPPGVSAEQDGH